MSEQPVWKTLLEYVKKTVAKKYEIKIERSTRFTYEYEGWTLELSIKEYFVVNAITVRALAVKLSPEDDEDSILNMIRSEDKTAIFYVDDMDNHIYAEVQTVIENKTGYTLRVHDSLSSVATRAAANAQLIGNIQNRINKNKQKAS